MGCQWNSQPGRELPEPLVAAFAGNDVKSDPLTVPSRNKSPAWTSTGNRAISLCEALGVIIICLTPLCAFQDFNAMFSARMSIRLIALNLANWHSCEHDEMGTRPLQT